MMRNTVANIFILNKMELF